MLEVLLGYDQRVKNSYLTMGLYSKDTATEMDLVVVGGANGRLKARSQYTKKSKMVEAFGLLYCNLISSDRLLLIDLPLKIVLHRQRDSFVLMLDDASRDCRVCIIRAQLCVLYIKLSDEKNRNIQQSLPATTACYPVKCVVIKTPSLAQGISSLNWENNHVGQLPNRVFMAMVDNDAYTGSIAKDPFNFKHFSACQVAIYLNGEMPAPPLNFVDNQYIDRYRSLFATAGQIDMDNGLDITRADYKSGYCIFGFDTSPSLCHGELQERKINGTLRVYVEFRAPLPNSINVIMYMEFDNTIFVDKTRQITKDY